MTIALAGGAASTGALLDVIRHRGPCTRADLTEWTGMARSTLNSRLDALIGSGLIADAGESESTGGRPPTRFQLNSTAFSILAVDLGATHATVAITDLSGDVAASVREELPVSAGPQPVLDRVIAIARQLLAQPSIGDRPVIGVGVGVPGPVEHASGRPTSPPIMPSWDGFDIPAYLRQHWDVPVLVDNDVNVMAIGEHRSAWPEVRHLLFVKIATGIGSGIIADGRINRGSQGTAGDLGHVQVPGAEDKLCRCGNVGCLEAVAAGPAMVERLRDLGCAVTTPQDVVDLVRAGDLQAIDTIRRAGREIGSVLASCVSLLNPSVIVIGGRMVAAGEFLLAGIREQVYQRAVPLAAQHLRIATSTTGDQAGVLGAATMVADAVLAPASVEQLVGR